MVSKKNRSLFNGALDAAEAEAETVAPADQDEAAERGRHRYLEGRTTALAKIAGGEYVHKTLHLIDPGRCRMWAQHNRRYELLDEARCADLIEGIKAQGGQEFPAIVRPITDDPAHDYEVVCGARRHWAINWLREHHYDFKFLIEIRELSDEEAFRLSDVENRDRADISDYERAVDYRQALDQYYKTLSQMAERLEVTVDWLSRYLDLAALPEPIVAAYPDVTHIRIQHARELKPLLKDRKTRERVLERAGELAARQATLRADGASLLDGKVVVRELKAATRAKKTGTGVLHTYQCETTRKPMLEVSRRGRSGLTLRVVPDSGAAEGEILDACKAALAAYGR